MKQIFTLIMATAMILSLSSQAQQNIGIGTTSPVTNLDVNGSVSYREGTALSLSNGTNSNIAIGTNSFFRITGPTAAFTITGLVPPTGANGMIVTLYNTTAEPMTIVNDATSTAANQITTLTGANVTTPAGPNAVQLQYNATQSKWILIGGQNILSVPSAWLIAGNSTGLTSDFGTPAGGSFVGTTTTIPLSFRVNNVRAGFVDNTTAAGSSSTFLGYLAGNFGTFGSFTTGPASVANVYVGYEAGTSNGSGSAEANDNVGIGYLADASSTTGTYNTSVGALAFSNQTGINNTSVGYEALEGPGSFSGGPGAGNNNVALGYAAFYALNNTSGTGNNTAVGANSGGGNPFSGTYDLFLGANAGSAGSGATTTVATTTGNQNTFVGGNSGAGTGGAAFSNSTALGYNATVTASNMMVLGNNSVTATEFNGALLPYYSSAYHAGTSGQVLTSQGTGVAPQWVTPAAVPSAWLIAGNSTGLTSDFGTPAGGSFVGTTTAIPFSVRVNNVRAAFIDNTTAAGSSSTFLGYLAGNFGTFGSFTTGPASVANVYVGYEAGTSNGSGSAEANDNVGIGYLADASSTTGTYNTSVGALAFSNQTGINNTSVGYEALEGPGSFSGGPGAGNNNVALGYAAFYALNNTSGTGNNTAVGANSGGGNPFSGTYDLFLGANAGSAGSGATTTVATTTGNQNTFVGGNSGAGTGGAAFSNSTALGYNATVTASNMMVLGNNSVTATEFNGALLPYYSSAYHAGTSGQVLTSQGTGVAPQWVTPAAVPSAWLIAGNSTGLTSDFGTPAGGSFVGTTTAIPFSVRVNNVRAAFIDNTTAAGSSSTFLGYLAGNFGTFGSFTTGPASVANVYVGFQAGTSNGSGGAEANDNVGIGYDADLSSTTGTYNTSVGALAFENQTGSNNTAIGYEALLGPSSFLGGPGSSSYNTALGYEVGTGVTSGAHNVFIGDGAAPNITTGTGNVIIGDKAGTNTNIGTNVSGKLIIESQQAASAPLITGDFASHTVALGGALTLHTAETSTTTFGGHLDVQSTNIPSETSTTFSTGGTYTVTPTSSTDVAGSLSITPGSSATASVTFTFGGTYTNAPIVIITPTNANAAGATAYISGTTATTFTITLTGATSTAYTFNYFVIETQ